MQGRGPRGTWRCGGTGLQAQEDARHPCSIDAPPRASWQRSPPLHPFTPLGLQERQTLEEAEALLKQLGFKGSLFAGQQQQQQQQQQQPDGGTAADEAA